MKPRCHHGSRVSGVQAWRVLRHRAAQQWTRQRTVVTQLLHCCYTVVTLLLHCCHIVVILLRHCCDICCDTVVTQELFLFSLLSVSALPTPPSLLRLRVLLCSNLGNLFTSLPSVSLSFQFLPLPPPCSFLRSASMIPYFIIFTGTPTHLSVSMQALTRVFMEELEATLVIPPPPSPAPPSPLQNNLRRSTLLVFCLTVTL
jgi:hypothetical protein